MRAYRLLLWLFPPGFRAAYGEEMARLFRDRHSEVRNRPAARAWLWGLAVVDVTIHAAWEWLRELTGLARKISREGMTMSGWIQDLKLGVRSLARRPGFTLAAVVTLALGIGANVAIFSVVDGVLLQPLPYPDSDALVVVGSVDTRDGTTSTTVDHPDVRYWQKEIPGLMVAGVAGTRPTLTGLGQPEVIQAARVTDGLLAVFGLEPELGRDIRREEDVAGGPDVVVISHAFWQQRLGGAADVIGRTLTLSGKTWEIVGVAPAGFDYPDGAELWEPRHHDEKDCGHGCRIMAAVGRIAPGSTLEEVQSRLDAASKHLAEAFPDQHRDDRTVLHSMLDQEVGGVRNALWVLMGAVAMVLLIACANV
ncbi:MAG: ABC transporter permease, partial [Gemmatimonadota bacterium]